MAISAKLKEEAKAKQAAKHAKKQADQAAKNAKLLSFKQVLGKAKVDNEKVARLKKADAVKEEAKTTDK